MQLRSSFRPVVLLLAPTALLALAGCEGDVHIGEFADSSAASGQASASASGGADIASAGAGGGTAASGQGGDPGESAAGGGGSAPVDGGFTLEPDEVACVLGWLDKRPGSAAGPTAKASFLAPAGDSIVALTLVHRPEDGYRGPTGWKAISPGFWSGDDFHGDNIAYADGWTQDGPDVVGRARRSVGGILEEGLAFIAYKHIEGEMEDPPIVRIGRGFGADGSLDYTSTKGFVQRGEMRALAPIGVEDYVVAWQEGSLVGLGRVLGGAGQLEEPFAGELDLEACGSGVLPVAATPVGDAALVVAADQRSQPGDTCAGVMPAAATSLRTAVVLADGSVASEGVLDLGATVLDVRATSSAEGAWVAARTDEVAITLHPVDAAGAVGARVARIELPSTRPFAIAARGPDLIVVDAGDDRGAGQRIRVRIWNRDGHLVGRAAEVAELGIPMGAPTVIPSPDGNGVLVGVPELGPEWGYILSPTLLRAACAP